MAHGGYVQNTVTQTGGNGGTEPADAVFGTTSTCSTLIPWETESYNATTGAWVFHFNNGTYHSAGGDLIYLCFDRASVTTQQNTGSYAPGAVWNDGYFQGVWHVPNGTTLSLLDSTAGAHNGTLTTISGTALVAGAGVIDGCVYESAAGPVSYSSVPDSTAFNSANMTVSAWIKTSDSAYLDSIMERDSGASRQFQFRMSSADANFIIFIGGSAYSVSSSVVVNDGNWHHVVGTFNGSTLLVYVDGVQKGTTSVSGSIDTGAGTALFLDGSQRGNFTMPGYQDEYRFSSTARSADWITAEYGNQKASSTFLTVGSLH